MKSRREKGNIGEEGEGYTVKNQGLEVDLAILFGHKAFVPSNDTYICVLKINMENMYENLPPPFPSPSNLFSQIPYLPSPFSFFSYAYFFKAIKM